MMADAQDDWRPVFERARTEADPATRKNLCAEARRRIQDRMLAIANQNDEVQKKLLEQALREICSIEASTET